jgi:YHS domain-containing protein
MATDPVCGMEVYENSAPATTEYEGVTYYFCSKTCQGTFEDNPQAFVKAAA